MHRSIQTFPGRAAAGSLAKAGEGYLWPPLLPVYSPGDLGPGAGGNHCADSAILLLGSGGHADEALNKWQPLSPLLQG